MAAVATTFPTSSHIGNCVDTMDDDAEEVQDFFTFKPKPRKPKAAVQKRPIVVDDSDSGGSSDDASKKRKRRTDRSRSHAWIRGESSEAARRRSESRGLDAAGRKASSKARDIVEIVDEEDEAPSRPTLEPPPELSEEALQRTQRITEAFIAQALDLPDDGVADEDEPLPEVRPTYHGPPTHINVTMVADPERQNSASKVALKHYTKLRRFTIRRDQPMSIVRDGLAQALGKAPEEIVLVWKGGKLRYPQLTPQGLLMSEGEQLEGYERYVWEKLEAEKSGASRRDRQDEVSGSQASGAADLEATDQDTAAKERISVVLKGDKGQFRAAVLPTTTAGDVVAAYVKKFSISDAESKKLRVVFDGERVDNDSTVGDMEWEVDDMVEIST